jgi:predicted house-cleaning noncanonical NTP pyrophosphatase (MazG superfamily)
MVEMSQDLEYIEKIIRDAKSSVKISKEGRKIRIDVDRRTIRIPYDEDVLRRLRVIVEEVKSRIEKEREEALKNFYEMIKRITEEKEALKKEIMMLDDVFRDILLYIRLVNPDILRGILTLIPVEKLSSYTPKYSTALRELKKLSQTAKERYLLIF